MKRHANSQAGPILRGLAKRFVVHKGLSPLYIIELIFPFGDLYILVDELVEEVTFSSMVLGTT